MSDTLAIQSARANIAKAVAELRAAKANAEAKERERRISENTVMVLRGEGPWRRLCLICATEVHSVCVTSGGGQDCGEIIRCEQGHDCSKRFRVAKRGR